LCYHPALKPAGACRLCAVEISENAEGRKPVRLACILPVRYGMVVHTQGEAVQAARTKAFQKLLQMAPQAKSLIALARSYGVDTGPPADGCVRCRLCVRVCKEIVGPAALKMEKRDGLTYVVPIEGRCIGCGTCANICPTDIIKVDDAENVRTISIRNDVIGKHPLQTCEGCGKLYATPKFLEHIQQRTAAHTDVKTHHNYCPTCAKLFSDRVASIRDRSNK
jgi:predicted molibdopterin-dependent oxidoreductase YjgC